MQHSEGNKKKRGFIDVDSYAPIAHDYYIKCNLENISCPSYESGNKMSQLYQWKEHKKEQHQTHFLWDVRSIQTHWLVNMGENELIALEEQHPLELHPQLRSPPDHGRWDKWDMAASTASPLLHQHRESLLTLHMEINSVTSSKQSLAPLKWLSDSAYIFPRELRGLVRGSWTESIWVTGVKVLSACHPAFSPHHWSWMQKRALFNDVPTLWSYHQDHFWGSASRS